MRLSEKHLTLLTGGISVVLILALAGAGYFIQAKNLKQAKTALGVLEGKEAKEGEAVVVGKIQGAKNQIEQMKQLEEEIIELRQEKIDLQKKLPTKEEVSSEKYIDSLSQLGLETNVVIRSANAVQRKGQRGQSGQATTPAGLEEISYKLNVEGLFFDLMTFIYRLETYKRFIKVSEFTLSPMGKKTGQSFYKMSITITTYIYTEPFN